MTDTLKPIRNPLELNEAINEATRLHPGDPDAAIRWLLANYAFDGAIALSLGLDGQRQLNRMMH